MALKKNEKRLLIAIIPVVIIFLLDRVGVFSKKKSTIVDKTKQTIKNTVIQVTDAKKATKTGSMSAMQFDTWGRDPFATPEMENQKVAASRLNLKGIVWSDGKAYALINDVVLAEGQEKKGIKVERIEGRKVVCRRGGQSVTLQWSEKK